MVGVPGRSKGCSTCRRRKKKCDQGRPSCGNCIRGKYFCGGYERSMVIVHTDHFGKGSYTQPSAPQDASSRRFLSQCAVFPSLVLSDVLARSNLEWHCIDTFWELYLPKSATSVSWKSSSIHQEAKWVDYTSRSASQSVVLRYALSALSASKVGRDTHDKRLLQKGMELYGKTLAMLARELSNPRDVKSLGVLNSCRILALYEQLNDVDASAQNWKGHISGLMNLICLRSAEDFSHPGAHELFLEARYNGVVHALSSRKSTFLSNLEWMTEPWGNHSKDDIDTAMDTLIQVPAILEEWDSIQGQSQFHQNSRRAEALAARCSNLWQQSRVWYANFILTSEAWYPSCAEAVRRGLDNPTHQVNLPTILAGVGLRHLHAMSIYWTSCAILRTIIDLLHHKFPGVSCMPDAEHRAAKSDVPKYLICIALCSKHFLNPDLGLLATLSLSHAVTCLIRTLADHNECHPCIDKGDVNELRRVMFTVQRSGGSDPWITWRHGMNDANFDKHEVLHRYDKTNDQ